MDMGVWKRKINLMSYTVGVRPAFDKNLTQVLLLVKREFIISDINILNIKERCLWTLQKYARSWRQ